MTDNAAPPISISPPNTVVMPMPERSSSGRVWSMVALVVALMGLVLVGLLWQRLNLTQQELARRSQDAGVEAGQARSMAEQSQQLTQALQARLALAEARLSEVSLQRTQLDELMASLSRSRDDTLVHDLGANLRLAYQQAQLTGNLAPLVAALQSADERIARAAQPRLNPVQRAIAQDLERLQRAPLNDVTAAVMRIDELSRQVDDWPLIHAQPFGLAEVSPMLLTSVGDSGASESLSAAGQWWVQRWDWLWQHAAAQFQALVRISRIDSPEAALLAPEQSFFLRENIKLRLLNARLALMARQGDVVRADVQMVQALLQRYFRNDAPQVIEAMAALSRAAEQANDSEVPRPDETWAALAKAAGGPVMLKQATVRSVFWFLALAAAAVALSLVVGRNQAMVTVFWAPYRLDLSFNLLLFFAIAVFVLLHLTLRGLATLRALPEKASRWRAIQIERAISHDLLDALAQLNAGRFLRAKASAQRAAGSLQSQADLPLPQREQQTVLAHWLWAEAAHALQDRKQRDFYLKLALDERWSKSAPEAQDGALLRAVQWAIEDADAVAARAWWRQVPSRATRRIQALRLKLRLARMDGNRDEALETARLLSKHQAFSAIATASLVKALVLDSVRQTHDWDGLKRVWSRLSEADRVHPDVALAVAAQASNWWTSGHDQPVGPMAQQVATWLLPLWGRWAQLDDLQRQRLVLVLEQAIPHLGAEWLARVEQTQQQWPQHASLQYLAGQACLQRRLWGKAQQLLGQASQSLKDPTMLRRVWCALAKLAQERGDVAAEQAAWKTAAQIP